jgi:hypothetical protein
MKIALCLSGQPRFIEDGYKDLYNNLLSKYNVDCFIHTWWDPEMENKDMNTLDMSNPSGRSYIYKNNTIDLLYKFYHPKKFIIEEQKQFKIFDNVDYRQPNKTISVPSFLYSIKKSNELKTEYEKENNFYYDAVIRCRTDIKIINFELDKIKNMDYIYTDVVGLAKNFPNDQLAISSSKNMNYYSTLYDYIETYINEGNSIFVGEHLLKYHLEKKQLLYFSPFIKNDIYKTI